MNNSRPPPPNQPRAGYMNRMYNRDLRPIVICLAVVTTIWAMFGAASFFRSTSIDRSQNQHGLAGFSIGVGIAYAVIAVISIFGTTAATMRRTALVRLFSYGAVVSALLAAGAGLAKTVVHYTKKDALISECQNLTEGGEVVFRYGWWGPMRTHVVNPEEAERWCRNAWDRESISEIISLLIIILLAVFFTMITFAYVRQLMDPSSAANAFRAPSNQARGAGAYPNHYNPAYGNNNNQFGGYNPNGYGYNNNNAAPPYGGPGPYAVPPGAPPPEAVPPYQGKGYDLDGDDKGAKNSNPFDDFEGSGRNDRRDRD